jgi:hypothetical protein
MSRVSKGFTLIELMLAMSFVAMLLVAIAMTTIQVSNIYTKGITLREVNQAGRLISDDLQDSVAAAEPFTVDTSVSGARYVASDGGGRLCLGLYSYVWNYGKALAEGAGEPDNTYDEGGEPPRFAKVADAGGGLCSAAEDESAPAIPKGASTELLASGDRNLVIHFFNISKTQEDAAASQALYAITFRIGMNDRELLTANDASCRPPSDAAGGENYCSVNQFDIIARAGNAEGGN